jgi:hypothetical protein
VTVSPKPFDLQSAFNDKMLESKIDPAAVKRLQLAATPANKVPKDTPFQEPGILIPYFDINGKKTAFWRFRYLKQPEAKGFSALTKKKPLKYVQAAKSLNEIYLPPVVDWADVAKDPMQPILITEGEFKAACASINTEYPTIGLGGVWSWKSKKRKMEVLPEFDLFNWDQRPVYIVYDSDAVTNPMVMQAENALAKALTNLGAEPHVVRLPMGDDNGKVGLDDFIVAKGVEALDDLLETSDVWLNALELHRLNEEVVYVRDPGLILRVDNLQRMSPRAFIDHAYSTRVFFEEVATAKSITRIKKIAPKEWIQWPSRAEVPRITYAPGEERVTEKREMNIWPGWGCEPAKGDITPWRELLDHLFKGEPEARQWFERWCAWPLQHPGDKLYSSPVIWGRRHGTGKSMIGYTLGKIYGKNFTEVDDEILRASHNEWAENKQFVMGDEITTGDKRSASDRMKTMITRKQLRLNPKYIPSYTTPDVINYYFTSNHPDAFFLEDDDRRFFIHEVREAPMADEWYKKYEKWMGAQDTVGPGIPALFHHLLNLDMGDFLASSRALSTRSKMDMMANSRSDLGTWVASLREDPDTVLRAAGHPIPFHLWRTEDLLAIYDPDNKGKVTSNGMARELARQGFHKAADGMGVRTSVGQVKLWIVRNVHENLKLTPPKQGQLYDFERGHGKNRSRR